MSNTSDQQTAGSSRYDDNPVKPPAAPSGHALSNATNNNPFRQRLMSQTVVPNRPPLPPRQSSISDRTPPRLKTKPSSSTSSSGSSDRFSPTRRAAPSTLMRQSLEAAQLAQIKPAEAVIHVLRSSTVDPPPLPDRHQTKARKASLVDVVNNAVKESEAGPPPPPRRVSSTRHSAQVKNASADTEFWRTHWTCSDIFSAKSSTRYALIILNQPIDRRDVFLKAWSNSSFRLCADGGANRLHDLLGGHAGVQFLPDMIKGDLDSVRPDVRDYYASKGVEIKEDGDQYSTDLMKCIREVEIRERTDGKKYALLLLGGLSGRIDQTVHTMALLHKTRKSRPETYVLSGDSLAWVLDTGSHLIDIDHGCMGETCGILPVGVDEARVRTTGLKWNLDWPTSFDTQVSTSNHLLPSEPYVSVETSRPILWCVEIQQHLASSLQTTTEDDSSTTRDLGVATPSAYITHGVDEGTSKVDRSQSGHRLLA